MNARSIETRAQIVSALVEGNGINTITRNFARSANASPYLAMKAGISDHVGNIEGLVRLSN